MFVLGGQRQDGGFFGRNRRMEVQINAGRAVRIGRIGFADQRAVDEKASDNKGWSGFLSDVWTSLKGLVTVRRVTEQSAAILPLEQRGYLYQNLALKLEAARYSLLLNNDVLYHQSLAAVSNWLQQYFDNQDPGVKAVLTTLQHIDAVKLDRELPVASSSLAALQRISLKDETPDTPLPISQEQAPRRPS